MIQSILFIATARFGEAIIDFLADENRAASKGIRMEDFEGEAYSVYELFSTVWLQSKEAKVELSLTRQNTQGNEQSLTKQCVCVRA